MCHGIPFRETAFPIISFPQLLGMNPVESANQVYLMLEAHF